MLNNAFFLESGIVTKIQEILRFKKSRGSMKINSKSRPTVMDLFSGVGGMSLGFEAGGFDVVVASELDPIHAAAHHFNFPMTKTICGDVREIKSIDLESILLNQGLTELDVIVGGPPCQGFSQIGKRQLSDPRNSLVFEFCRIVSELRPKYVVFENVPGMAHGKHANFIEEVVDFFNNEGYVVNLPYRVLDASLYGTPQRRKRLVLLAARSDCKSVQYPIPTCSEERSGTLFLFEDMCEIMVAEDAIDDLKSHPVFIGDDSGISHSALSYEGSRNIYSPAQGNDFALCHRRKRTSDKIYGHVGSRHTELSQYRFANTIPGKTEKVSRFYRLHPKRPCTTLRAGTASDRGAYTAPRPIHYSEPRCITIREAARLHSFPDWFDFHRTIWHGFRQIGNAVSPLFAKAIADTIFSALGYNSNEIQINTFKLQNKRLLNFTMSEAADYFNVKRDVIPPRKRLVKVS